MKHLQTYEASKYKTLSRRKHLKGKVEMLVEKYAPWYDLYDKQNAIYRGVVHKDGRKINQDVYMVDPSEHNRVSVDTNNIYTLIMDNSEYWSDLPKRSESLVCSTDYNYASMFGQVYRIIPLKPHEEFGLCDSKDIFDSFVGLKYINDNIDNPSDLDTYLDNTFNMPHGVIKSYEQLNKIFSKENLNFESGYKEGETFSGMTAEKFDEIVEEYGSYLNYLEYLMEPEKNGFRLMEYVQVNSGYDVIFNQSHELWTDVPCLMVREDYIQRNF